MADGVRSDPAVPGKVAALVVDAFGEALAAVTTGMVSVDFVQAWRELVLRALARDVPAVAESLRWAHPAARERLTLLLRAHGWCASCAAGERDGGGVHACDIVVEETGQVCACTGCGPL